MPATVPPHVSQARPALCLSDPGTYYEELSIFEVYWRDKQKFLESRGYMLRSRYHPDWVQSWKKGEALRYPLPEDAIKPFV